MDVERTTIQYISSYIICLPSSQFMNLELRSLAVGTTCVSPEDEMSKLAEAVCQHTYTHCNIDRTEYEFEFEYG